MTYFEWIEYMRILGAIGGTLFVILIGVLVLALLVSLLKGDLK